jgi:hypothetical protein
MAHIEERDLENGKTKYRVQIRVRGYPQKTDVKRGAVFQGSRGKKRTLRDLIDRYVKEVLPRKPKNACNVATQLNWWKQTIGNF